MSEEGQVDVFCHFYDGDVHQSDKLDGVEELELGGEDRKTWIAITGDVNGVIRELASKLELSYYLLSDIMELNRPQVEKLDSYLVFTLRELSFDEEDASIQGSTLSIVLGEDLVITLSRKPVFKKIESRLEDEVDKIRDRDSSFLVYIIVNDMVNNYFSLLEKISEEIEGLQQQITSEPEKENMIRINLNRRKVLFIQKNIRPLRQVTNKLERDEFPLISDRTASAFRLLEDQVYQLIDEIDSLKDLLAHLLEIYMSTISNRMNDIMKVLTIIGTVFLPLSFITGIYGMNFRYMPELSYRYGYPLTLLFMLALGLVMLGYFKQKKWI